MWTKIFERVALPLILMFAKDTTKKLINVDWSAKFDAMWSSIKKWWNGKTIAVIGSTASGKNSFFARLKKEEIPSEHFQSRGADKVKNFKIEHTLADGTKFCMNVKGSVNVGGELDQRPYWLEACKDADVIFYLIDYEKLTHKYEVTKERIKDDFLWMLTHITEFSKSPYVFMLMNKIDIDSAPDRIETLKREIEELGKKYLPGYYTHGKVKGIFPISMTDDSIYHQSFHDILASMVEINDRK